MSGAGPASYGLFHSRREAVAATRRLPPGARSVLDRGARLVTSPTVSSVASGSPDGVERHPGLLAQHLDAGCTRDRRGRGDLIVVGVIPRWIAIGIALGLVVAVYFAYGRRVT